MKRQSNRIIAMLLIMLMCIGMMPITSFADNEPLMTFFWKGEQRSVIADSSDSADGIAWSADSEGNVSFSFTQSGTFTVLSGKLEDASASLTAGGAGGSSAGGSPNNGFGGNGGGKGETISSPVSISIGESINIVVGKGGQGGQPSTTAMSLGYISPSTGEDGGDSYFGELVANGGIADSGANGAHGVGPGNDSNDGFGAGGGSVDTFFETDCGNFRPGQFSCFICGTNQGEWYYNISGWTPLYQNASDPGNVQGGIATNGGGNGGNPENEHGHGPRTGGNGLIGTGGGGGGGAYATRIYCLGYDDTHAPTGSAYGGGFAGAGGNGGDGIVRLSAKVNPKVQIELTKESSNPNMTNGSSCYSLEGAVYGIYSDEACNELVEELTTDSSGYTISSELPQNTYYLKEITAPKGFFVDSKIYTVTPDNTKLTVTDKPKNDPVGISITKITDDEASTIPSLAGTQFTVNFYAGQYSSVSELPAPTKSFVIEAKEETRNGVTKYLAALNDECKVSGDGFYYLDDIVVFPLGTLTIQETKPADGYTLIGGFASQAGTAVGDDNGVVLMNITEDGSITGGAQIDFGNEFTKIDELLYGGLKVQKLDFETGEDKPQGSGSFEGIELEIVSLNENDITVDGKVYSKDDVVFRGKTDANGSFQTREDLLPKGMYKVVEKTASSGYLINGKTEAEFEVKEHRKHVELHSWSDSIADKPIRADFSIMKQDSETLSAMADVEFKITSNTSGESHTFKTNEKGVFNSASSDLHFGASAEGGALLFDTYIIEELECDANLGYKLSEPITFTVDGSERLITLPTVYNAPVKIATTAKDSVTNNHVSQIAEIITIIDTVSYENLYVGKEYTLQGKLMDKATGEVAVDSDGNEIKATTTFVPVASNGSVEVKFVFPGNFETSMKLVAFEELIFNEKTVVTHADINDMEQTVYVPKISTSAKNPNTNEQIGIADKMSIIDTVSYDGLLVGEEYILTGSIVDADNPDKVLGGALTVFTAQSENGKVELEFTVDAKSYAGKKLVVFEKLSLDGNIIAIHEDVTDVKQTITIPNIRTEAKAEGTNDHFPSVGESVTIIDTVSYENLIPNKTYTLSGKLVMKSKPETVVAEAKKSFTPAEANGTVEMEFIFDASMLGGETVVAFEDLSFNDVLLVSHADIEDEAQSVYFAGFGTSASVNNHKTAMAIPNVSLIDTVEYKNLKPNTEYKLKGTLVDKSTGKELLDANGMKITAEAKFTPTERDGKTFVTFTFDASRLDGKSVVVFEKLYLEDELVFVHEDINDKEQTVRFTSIPITGDGSNIWLYISLMAFSLCGIITAAEAVFKRRPR